MRRTAATILVLTALLLSGADDASSAGETPSPFAGLHNDGGRFADAEGRTVILRGVNAMDKYRTIGDADLDPDDLTDAALARIADIGFNSLRLGLTWDAVEHTRGTYDEAFLDRFVATLDRIHAHGLVAVVDVHQDVFSESIGSDGAPPWAVPQCNLPPSLPISQTTGQWFTQYFSPDVMTAWSNFWNDGYGTADPHCTGPVQTRFVLMWNRLAERLANHPAVVGYDILNEPWPGSPPGVFELVQLYPFYERVAAAIRTHDDDAIIFFEPPIWKSAALPSPALRAPDPNSAYAPHIYTETMFSGGQVTTGATSDEVVLRSDVEEAERLGVPLWIGEWGAFENAASRPYQDAMYDLFDAYGVSSAYWLWTQGSGGGLQAGGPSGERGHVRVYPEAYPGDATWTYDADAALFVMTVTVGAGTHTTRIVVPSRLGIDTDVPGTTFDPSTHRLAWTVEGPGTFTLSLD